MSTLNRKQSVFRLCVKVPYQKEFLSKCMVAFYLFPFAWKCLRQTKTTPPIIPAEKRRFWQSIPFRSGVLMVGSAVHLIGFFTSLRTSLFDQKVSPCFTPWVHQLALNLNSLYQIGTNQLSALDDSSIRIVFLFLMLIHDNIFIHVKN